MTTRRHRQIAAIAALLVTLALQASGALRKADMALQDAYSRWLRHEVSSEFVIVAIDEASLHALNHWPWKRGTHAQLLDQLRAAHPRRVFMDIDFSSQSLPLEDALLAQAVSRWPPEELVLPAFAQDDGSGRDMLYTQPLPEVAAHASLASVNIVPGADSLIRDIKSYWNYGDRALPAVFWRLVDGEHSVSDITIDYSIDPASFETFSYVDVLAGRVDPRYFADKTVLVGAMAVELGDMQPVPLYGSLPGVVVETMAAATVRSGGVRHLPASVDTAALALWTLLVACVLRSPGWRLNALIAGMAAVVAVAIGAWARKQGVMADIVGAPVSVGVCFVVLTVQSLDLHAQQFSRMRQLANRRRALLNSIVSSSAEGIVCVNSQTRILSANPAAERLLGCTSGQLNEKLLRDLVPTLGDYGELRALTDLNGRITEHEATGPDGGRLPVEVSVTPIPLGRQELYTVLLRDLRERKAQEQRLHIHATRDSLTGLPNRFSMIDALQARMSGGPQGSGKFGLFVLDLTRFKEVNDTLGHDFGDDVLRQVAARFEMVTGDRGTVYRMGGDEFVVISGPIQAQDEFLALADSLGDCLKTPIAIAGLALDIGVNIGIAMFPGDAQDASTLLRFADIAMYAAKRDGDLYGLYTGGQNDYTRRRLSLLADLRKALESGELELHYQPQVHLKGGSVQSVESLLRWHHPRHGDISPQELIPLVESTDLVIPLTDWTVDCALRQQRRWRDKGISVRIAVNLSARMLHDLSLPSRMGRLLIEHDVHSHMIELEITESSMLRDVRRALEVVSQLRSMGFLVSVDDYGTGFSSLSYLRDLAVQTLKMDRSFIADLERSESNRIIVQSTILLAHSLRIEVVAEGVEDDWQVEFLTRADCDVAQGYYFARPMPEQDCEQWLLSRPPQPAAENSGARDEMPPGSLNSARTSR